MKTFRKFLKLRTQLLVGVILLSLNSFAQTYGSNCYRDLCLGQRVFNIERNFREAEIVGIENSGTYVLRFQDTGGVGGNWNREALAVKIGCTRSFCVNERAFNIERNFREVTVVGIQFDGRIVVRFQDTGGVGGNWTNEDLAKPQGCGIQFCVGDVALNNKRNYRQVTVVGIQSDRRYVLRFHDTNAVGGNWTDEDLARTGQTPQPPYPPAPYPNPQPQPPYPPAPYPSPQPQPPYPPAPYPNPQPQPPYPPAPPQYVVIEGPGLNRTQSPEMACWNQYRLHAARVEYNRQQYTCTPDLCGRIFEWKRVFCAR